MCRTQPPKKTAICVSMRYKGWTVHRQRIKESIVLFKDVTFFTTMNVDLTWGILATILTSPTMSCVNWKFMVSLLLLSIWMLNDTQTSEKRKILVNFKYRLFQCWLLWTKLQYSVSFKLSGEKMWHQHRSLSGMFTGLSWTYLWSKYVFDFTLECAQAVISIYVKTVLDSEITLEADGHVCFALKSLKEI